MASFHRPRQPGASLARRAIPRNTGFEPIPARFAQGRQAPFRMDLGEVLTAGELQEITQAGSMAFHCMGDTGGVKNPEPQRLVERGLEQSLHGGEIAPSLRGAARRWRRPSATTSATSSTTMARLRSTSRSSRAC